MQDSRTEGISTHLSSFRDASNLTKLYLDSKERVRRFYHPFPFAHIKTLTIMRIFVISHHLIKIIKPIVPTLAMSMQVAEDKDGNKIGFAYFKVKKKEKGLVIANLGIMVKEGITEKGVGSKLMTALLNEARKQGIDKMQFTVLADNEAAIALYKKFGGVIIGPAPDDVYEGESLPNLYMEIDLKTHEG